MQITICSITYKDFIMVKMDKNYFISIYLDGRRAKSNGEYPVKLRVFTTKPRKQKLYPTSFQFTKEEFKMILEAKKPNNQYYKIKMSLMALETQAYEIADKLPLFTFEDFERMIYNTRGSHKLNVNFYYQKAIENYKRNNQLGTASNYELSLKSLLAFHGKDDLDFETINSQWIKDYEEHMVNINKRSTTTVGMYLRPLRAVFNTAIFEKAISMELYPFGKRKYTIPSPRSIKKALSKEQLKQLWEATPETDEQQKAKDFWFLSYFCNGINPRDLLYLQNKDVSEDKIIFNRTKTVRTNKSQAPVTIYLNDHAKEILIKYRSPQKNKDAYLFPIIDTNANPTEKYRQIQNFIRFINQHIVKFANSIGIDEKISCNWSRHSFATTAIRSGFSMEMVSEALSHSNLKTTKGYFAGFEDDKKREISQALMKL